MHSLGLLEWQRPLSEGTIFWVDRQPGESWRRRQGDLLLPGLHPHTQLHEDVVQVSSG